MAETTIQWADYTFNPWVGCQRVSPGCEHCYAEDYDRRVGGVPKKHRPDPTKPLLRWGPKAPRWRTKTWGEPVKWNAEAAAAGVRKRVFCASLADVFEQLVPGQSGDLDAWRIELFELVRVTPHLDWLLLTKRPQLVKHGLTGAIDAYARTPGCSEAEQMLQRWVDGEPPSNVWLGTTVEDQQRANERIPHLVAVPAVVRFLSCEPLLEQIDLSRWMDEDLLGFVNSPIDWVIVGGESGSGARPFDLAWARSIIGQCRDGGRSVEPTPFMKQLGARPVVQCDKCDGSGVSQGWNYGGKCHPCDGTGQLGWPLGHRSLFDSHGGDPAEWPADLRIREFPEVRRG